MFSAGSAFSTINDKDLRTLEKIVKGQCDIEALKIPDGVATDWYPLGFTECFKRQSRSLQAELVIACDLPALPAAVEFAHRTRAKLIYDAHEMYPFQKEFSERQKLVLAYYEAKLLPRVDVCVTVSDRIVEFMKNVYGKHLPIYCINNCADFVDGNGVKRVLREKCGINSTDPVFLYHGGFSEGRMLKELGEAFLSSSVMKESYLVYLGSGQLNSELRTLAKTSKGKIFVLDAVAQEDLPGYICDADFVTILYPALDENTKNAFPNKLGDCITLGVPFFGSSEMLTLHDVAERFSIGYVGLARTREQISRELTAAISWRANNKNFDFQGARGALGWGAQRKQFESLVLSLF
nr:hypothetical protein CKG001_14650 [Bdellovibrio sp. CKG001]